MGYLKGTYYYYYYLSYYGYLVVLEGYCDANSISYIDYVKPTNGYVFTLTGGVVSWKLSKKTCTMRSNMETELVALEKAGSEALWLRSILIDCQVSITCVKSKVYNGKS